MFIDTVGMKSADLKDKSLFWSFAARPSNSQDVGKEIKEIKSLSNRYGCALVISFYISKVFLLCRQLRVQAQDCNSVRGLKITEENVLPLL